MFSNIGVTLNSWHIIHMSLRMSDCKIEVKAAVFLDSPLHQSSFLLPIFYQLKYVCRICRITRDVVVFVSASEDQVISQYLYLEQQFEPKARFERG